MLKFQKINCNQWKITKDEIDEYYYAEGVGFSKAFKNKLQAQKYLEKMKNLYYMNIGGNQNEK